MHLVMQSKFDDISLLILTSHYLHLMLASFKEFLFQLLHYHVQSPVSIFALQVCLSVSTSTECICSLSIMCNPLVLLCTAGECLCLQRYWVHMLDRNGWFDERRAGPGYSS